MALTFGWRHIVILMSFFGYFIIYCLRVNLSVALVAMVNQTAIKHLDDSSTNKTAVDECGRNRSSDSDTDSSEDGKYVWDQNTQGLILGSFFYGYIVMQIPGGWIARKFGGKWVFGIGTVWTAILTLLTPIAAEAGIAVFVALRVLMGMGEAVTFPAMHTLYSQWVPPLERSKMPAFADTGTYVGTVVAFAVSGYLAASDFLGGWPSVFYVFGALGIFWFCLWAILVSNSPKDHRWISKGERAFIVNEIAMEKRSESPKVPLKSIATSLPFLAIIVSHCSHNWGFYTMLTELPNYMKNILGFKVKQNGLISALPYLCQAIIQNVVGQIVDFLRQRGYVSTVVARKASDGIAHFVPGTCILLVGFVGCNTVASVALLTLGVGMTGFVGSGFFVNHLDIAPQYAGLLFGISNTFATIPGIVGPTIVGLITNNNETRSAWRKVFIIAACIYYFATVFFLIFARGTVQPWARSEDENEKVTEKPKIKDSINQHDEIEIKF